MSANERGLKMALGPLASLKEQQRQDFGQRCTACGDCVRFCPAYERGLLSIPPETGMEHVVSFLREGTITPELREMAKACTACRQCKGSCPVGLDPHAVRQLTSSEMFRAGVPAGGIGLLASGPYGRAGLFGMLQNEPGQERWLTRMPSNPVKAETVLYLGCISMITPFQALSLFDILQAMEMDFVAVGGDEFCCGYFDSWLGDLEAAETKAKALATKMAAFQPRQVVTPCRACNQAVASTIPLLSKERFRSQFAMPFLHEHLDRLRSHFTTPIEKAVTYHDACSVGRGSGLYEEPRHLIQAIPGLRYVEMERNREKAACCGGLSTYSFPELSRAMRHDRLKEAADAGAEILVTACVGCQLGFTPGAQRYGIEVIDYITLLARAMGFRHEDTFAPLVEGITALELAEKHKERFADRDFGRAKGIMRQYLEMLALD